MKITKLISFPICLFLICIFNIVLPSKSFSVTYSVIQITNNDDIDDSDAAYSNGKVVWSSGSVFNKAIMLFDGNNSLPIIDDTYQNFYPDINSSGKIVWTQYNKVQRDLMLFNGTDIVNITNNSDHEYRAYINDQNNIIWTAAVGGLSLTNHEVFFYDNSTGVTTRITNDSRHDTEIQFNETGIIVWAGHDGNDYEIYRWSGGTITKLTDNDFDDRLPKVNDRGDVSWFGGYNSTGGGWNDVYFRDANTGTTTILTANVNRDDDVQLNNNGQLAWRHEEPPFTSDGTFSIAYWNGSTIDYLADDNIYSGAPRINNNNHLVWEEWVNTDYEIFLYDGNAITQITNDEDNNHNGLQFFDDGTLLWWANNPDYEVFIARPVTNTAPVADAGPDQSLSSLGIFVDLDGQESYDLEGDEISYSWSLTQKPEGSQAILYDSDLVAPRFQADVYGEYTITLVVTDIHDVASQPDQVVVSFENLAPVADAGVNQIAHVGDTVNIDGSGSSDANDDPLTFLWTIVSKPAGSTAEILSNIQTSEQASFITDIAGEYLVRLVVNDGYLNSDPSEISIEAISTNDQLTQGLENAIDKINQIDPEYLKNKNMKKTLTNKLIAVIESVNQGNYQEALDKLVHDILAKMNGCVNSAVPDKNDWIQDCDAQNKSYPVIMEIVSLLEELI